MVRCWWGAGVVITFLLIFKMVTCFCTTPWLTNVYTNSTYSLYDIVPLLNLRFQCLCSTVRLSIDCPTWQCVSPSWDHVWRYYQTVLRIPHILNYMHTVNGATICVCAKLFCFPLNVLHVEHSCIPCCSRRSKHSVICLQLWMCLPLCFLETFPRKWKKIIQKRPELCRKGARRVLWIRHWAWVELFENKDVE